MQSVGKKFASFWISKYLGVVTWIEKGWEKTHPPSYKIYNVFRTGMKTTFSDFRCFVIIRGNYLSGDPLSKLTREELEIFRRVPKDIVRITPAIAVAVLPGSFVFLPVLYMFPRQFLTRQFWTDEQRIKFAQEDMTKQLKSSTALLKKLEKFDNISAELKSALDIIGREDDPGEPELIALASLFNMKPLTIDKLGWKHLGHLCRCHNLRTWPWFTRRGRLSRHAHLMALEDKAMLKENLDQLSLDNQQQICLLRGLYPYGLTETETLDYIRQWSHISGHVFESPSFLLHLPIFMAFNHPANRQLRVTHVIKDSDEEDSQL